MSLSFQSTVQKQFTRSDSEIVVTKTKTKRKASRVRKCRRSGKEKSVKKKSIKNKYERTRRHHVCSICKRRFKQLTNLKIHQKCIHKIVNQEQNIIYEASQVTPSNSNVNGFNINQNISAESCVRCKICLAKFSESNILKEHEKIHSCDRQESNKFLTEGCPGSRRSNDDSTESLNPESNVDVLLVDLTEEIGYSKESSSDESTNSSSLTKKVFNLRSSNHFSSVDQEQLAERRLNCLQTLQKLIDTCKRLAFDHSW